MPQLNLFLSSPPLHQHEPWLRPDLLGVYRDETISGDILAISDPEEFSFENTEDWVSLIALKRWYIRHCQLSSALTPSPHPFPLTLPGSSHDPFRTPSRTRSPPTNQARSASRLSVVTTSSPVTTPTVVKTEDDIIFVSAPTPTTNKRKRREVIEISDSESSDMEVKQAKTPTKPKKKLKREPDLDTENMRGIQITREAFIDRLVSVDDFKTCWPVSKGEHIGYLINATQDTRNWPERRGEKMSMAGKIKSFDEDAWGGGTAGSTKETPYVFPLQTECQVARHICQGIFHCNHVGHEFFNGVERYEPDPNQRQDWWEAERKQNQAESESSAGLAAIFYKELHVTPCPHVADDGMECAGLPVMRPLKEKNFDGKKSFIGCQGWRKGILEGTPSQIDPALANPRHRRQIIHDRKKDKYPRGTGLEGVLHLHTEDAKALPVDEQYIHRVSTSNDEEGHIIVTMLPTLARLIHQAKTTLHDNTYKRVKDSQWKEWEVVIWNDRLNMRVCVARIYMTRETRVAFRLVWGALWDTVAKVTGETVKFKFMHGSGISTILVDGSKPQINGAGDDFVERNWCISQETQLVKEENPQIIVQHIVRCCLVHLDRDFDKLSSHLSVDENQKIRTIKHLETQEEIKQLMTWCEKSSNKHIRDWASDKKNVLWFVPSINEHHSKIPAEDWYLSPSDTNLNKGSHPNTNLRTGTSLSLLEAIVSARDYDKAVASKIQDAEDNHVLPNHRNTVSHRLHINVKRAVAKQAKSNQYYDTLSEVTEVEARIKSTAQELKDLQARKKTLKVPRGTKARKDQGKAVKGKSVLADSALADTDPALDDSGSGSQEARWTDHQELSDLSSGAPSYTDFEPDLASHTAHILSPTLEAPLLDHSLDSVGHPAADPNAEVLMDRFLQLYGGFPEDLL
ncbi:hypothetical protein EYR36_012028 [Pleurotus pulmonarius]|nr:hypothetical protein EYR36_012028 [Pleurotus pulmonarius]